MTNFELNQADEVIKQAGRTAFILGIPLISNPYRKSQRLFKLWAVGHRNGKNFDDKRRDSNGRYRNYYEPVVTNPTCDKCSTPVPNTTCSSCGDSYESTEVEEKWQRN